MSNAGHVNGKVAVVTSGARGMGAAHVRAQARESDEVSGAGADNDAAVAAYRLSVKAGNPLSERQLARLSGRTSRRWARTRIAEARQSP